MARLAFALIFCESREAPDAVVESDARRRAENIAIVVGWRGTGERRREKCDGGGKEIDEVRERVVLM